MFIVYRHIDKTLKDILHDEKTSLTMQDTIQMGIQLIDCAENLHHTGYIHNDIKMENIMIRNDFRLHLVGYSRAEKY